jgi:hypothetical protein
MAAGAKYPCTSDSVKIGTSITPDQMAIAALVFGSDV